MAIRYISETTTALYCFLHLVRFISPKSQAQPAREGTDSLLYLHDACFYKEIKVECAQHRRRVEKVSAGRSFGPTTSDVLAD